MNFRLDVRLNKKALPSSSVLTRTLEDGRALPNHIRGATSFEPMNRAKNDLA
jgi:hypothetical protein